MRALEFWRIIRPSLGRSCEALVTRSLQLLFGRYQNAGLAPSDVALRHLFAFGNLRCLFEAFGVLAWTSGMLRNVIWHSFGS